MGKVENFLFHEKALKQIKNYKIGTMYQANMKKKVCKSGINYTIQLEFEAKKLK